jgi:uncharacterized protein YeaO (DUF488 family)
MRDGWRQSRQKEFAMIHLKRAYDAAKSTDGTRLLIERLWPRGVKKTSLKIKSWIKDVAPSTELRKWFSHDPAKWDKFRSRYFKELRANPAGWEPIVEAARHGTVTLIYSSHDTEHNNAVALQAFLQRRMHKKAPAHRRAA